MSFSKELPAHVILIGFAAYVIASANPGSNPFSWHPTYMILTWLLMTEGVLLFRKPGAGWRIAVHWAFQATGLTFAIIGFLAIYRNKENSGANHFVSYHGMAGLVTLVLLMVQAAGGNVANFSVGISRRLTFVKPKLIKSGHRVAGAFSLTALTATVFLAIFSTWFQAVTKSTLWYMVATVVGYPLIYTLKTTYF